MHENRETSLASAQADRSGKANNHKPDMHTREESDCAVVPVKWPNQEAKCLGGGCGGRGADQGERRRAQHEPDTERGTSVPGVRRRAPSGAGEEAGTVHSSAPPSDDRPTTGKLLRPEAERGPGNRRREVEEYEDGLEDRLKDLHGRVHRGAYQAHPREECIYRKPMGGNVRWASPHWKTKSFNRQWSRSLTRFMRWNFGASRTGFDRDAMRTGAGALNRASSGRLNSVIVAFEGSSTTWTTNGR